MLPVLLPTIPMLSIISTFPYSQALLSSRVTAVAYGQVHQQTEAVGGEEHAR